MNSCAYTIRLMHDRPGKNRFKYNIYMMYLDLDELEFLSKKFLIFSYNKWNLMSFHDKDHFLFVRQEGKADKIARATFDYTKDKYAGKNTKERVIEAAKELKLGFTPKKIFVLTNLRTLGYIFNPVSFYYCYDKDGKLRAMLSEVNNTFRDQKLFYTKVDPRQDVYKDKQKKNFYVSPFIDFDTEITWRFREPKDELFMEVNSVKGDKPILRTLLIGKRKRLSTGSLLYLSIRYPMMPLMGITLIHWQALRLWLKKVRFRRKAETDDQIVDAI